MAAADTRSEASTTTSRRTSATAAADHPLQSTTASILSLFTPAPQGVVRRVNNKLVLAEDSVSGDISLGGHAVLSFLFVAATVAYTVITLIAFFTRLEVEQFYSLPASDFAPVPLTVAVECTNRPSCGTTTIRANYSQATPFCRNVAPSVASLLPTETQAAPELVTLCYTSDQVFSVQTTSALPLAGVSIDFSAINPGTNKSTTPHSAAPELQASAAVQVGSPEDPTFGRLVNMDTWQVKTLVIGQNVRRKEGIVLSRQFYPLAIQYEGKRPNWRATLLVTLSPLVNVYETSKPGSLLEVIASIGGAISMITGALLVLSPIVGCVSPGPLADAKEEEDVDADGVVVTGGGGAEDSNNNSGPGVLANPDSSQKGETRAREPM